MNVPAWLWWLAVITTPAVIVLARLLPLVLADRRDHRQAQRQQAAVVAARTRIRPAPHIAPDPHGLDQLHAAIRVARTEDQ